MLLLKVILLVSFSFLFTLLQAQDTKPAAIRRCPVKTINFESGLLNNGTTGIITDKLGFTWVSTRTGLQRYNGYALQTILPVVGKDTFRINHPVYFFELKDGTIWISFKKTVLRYDPVSDLFSVVISLPAGNNSPFNVVPLLETEAGVWCMQEKKGIVIYSKQGKPVNQFSFFQTSLIDEILNSQELLYFNKITVNDRYIFINKNGSNNNYTAVNQNPGSILAINTASNEFKEINMPEGNILSLTCSGDKLYVLCGVNLYCITIHDKRIVRKTDIKQSGHVDFTSGNICIKGNLLLAGLDNHLYEFDTAGVYRSELTNLNRNSVVLTGFIHKIYPDKFKRIWLITNNDIKRIEDVEIPFTHFIYPNEKSNFVRALYYDNVQHLLLAGCFYTGIQLYDTMANALWKTPLSTVNAKNILAIDKLTGNNYLVITFDKGWYQLNLSAKTLTAFKIPPEIESRLQSRQVNFPNNLQRTGENTFLLATANNVFRCELSENDLRSATALLPDKMFQSVLSCFLYDSHNNLWSGTGTGILFRIDAAGKQQTISMPYTYGIRCIAEDKKNNIWVGTDKGLYVYSNSGVLLKSITVETGLKNDCIYALLPADSGTAVYASSNLGISYISLDGTIKNFSKEMGLQDNEFNTASACKTPGGKFCFGGINGITAFYPSLLSAIKDTPFLYITKLVVNDSLYNSSAGTWKNDSILLGYKQNRLRFDLAAIGLLNTNEYVYQYRMKGFESAWQTTYLPTGINYTLDPGTYDLEIICKPVLSSEMSFSKKFVIIIQPPWWQTWWFGIATIALLIGVIAFIVQQYNRRKYMKRIRALQTQYEIQHERERISRDLHDNIGVQANALLYGTEQLQKLRPGETALVDNLQSTARDMMQSLRETVWAMKNTNAKASEVWVRIISFCNQLNLIYKEIKIGVEGEAPENLILHSERTLHIVLIIQEAINNAVRHAKAHRIIVKGNTEDNGWAITINDDGHGFDKESDGKSSGGGFGLSNMRERATIAGISLTVTSQLEEGTSITLTIPF